MEEQHRAVDAVLGEDALGLGDMKVRVPDIAINRQPHHDRIGATRPARQADADRNASRQRGRSHPG
jgi:hypothetical protein